MNHFKVNDSVAFSTFTVLCNYQLYLIPKDFPSPQNAVENFAVVPRSSLPLAPLNHQAASLPMDSPTLDTSHKWTHVVIPPFMSGFFHLV